jgi:hypothetical protein
MMNCRAAAFACCILATATAAEESGAVLEPSVGIHGCRPWLANPAILGNPNYRHWELEIVSAAAVVANNGLNLSLYRRYNGEFLTKEDKDDILRAIPGSTLEGAGIAQLSAMGVKLGRLAFVTKTFAGAAVELDKDFLDIVFFGNELDRRYHLFNSGSSLAFSSFGLAYGRTVALVNGWSIMGGGSLRYVVGLEAMRVMESRGEVVTDTSGISGGGESRVRYSEGRGNGVAADLGAWASKGMWEIGVTVRDVGPAIRWHDGKEESYAFDIRGWTLEDEFEEDEDDNLYSEEKHSRDMGHWSTPLPISLEIMAGYHRYSGSISLRWTQGLRETAGATTKPRVQIAASWDPTTWVQPRLGLEVGAPEGFSLPFGIGLRAGPVRIDVALTGCRLPPSDSKALGLALAIGVSPG